MHSHPTNSGSLVTVLAPASQANPSSSINPNARSLKTPCLFKPLLIWDIRLPFLAAGLDGKLRAKSIKKPGSLYIILASCAGVCQEKGHKTGEGTRAQTWWGVAERIVILESYFFHCEGFPVPVTPQKRAAPACFHVPDGNMPPSSSMWKPPVFTAHPAHRSQEFQLCPISHSWWRNTRAAQKKDVFSFNKSSWLALFFFLHVSSHKQMSQPPGTSHSFNSSSALFVQCPCSHTLNSSLHRDKLSMLSLVMLQGGGADSPGTRKTVHERDKIASPAPSGIGSSLFQQDHMFLNHLRGSSPSI